jgi:hypothetical protein
MKNATATSQGRSRLRDAVDGREEALMGCVPKRASWLFLYGRQAHWRSVSILATPARLHVLTGHTVDVDVDVAYMLLSQAADACTDFVVMGGADLWHDTGEVMITELPLNLPGFCCCSA